MNGYTCWSFSFRLHIRPHNTHDIYTAIPPPEYWYWLQGFKSRNCTQTDSQKQKLHSTPETRPVTEFRCGRNLAILPNLAKIQLRSKFPIFEFNRICEKVPCYLTQHPDWYFRSRVRNMLKTIKRNRCLNRVAVQLFYAFDCREHCGNC